MHVEGDDVEVAAQVGGPQMFLSPPGSPNPLSWRPQNIVASIGPPSLSSLCVVRSSLMYHEQSSPP